MKFNIKSRKGFTLIELLVVIGILAVLAAITIPSVAGLIDRANVSADKTNSNEMTNAMERFASEYELFCQDIASGTFDKDNMDSAQGRVFNVLGIEDRASIELVEIDADEPVDDDAIAIYRDTKYPANAKTAQLIVQNYIKTSSSTFEPKQSDMHYWYSPDCGAVVVAEADANSTPENIEVKLNSQIISGKDAKGNNLDTDTIWIDLTLQNDVLNPNDGSTPKNNEIYTYGDYLYKFSTSLDGWSVSLNLEVTDKNQVTYGQILESINGKYIKSLYGTFQNCMTMTVAPRIPPKVTSLNSAFKDCRALLSAPDISHCTELTNMHLTFYQCTKMRVAPVIPESVKTLTWTFVNCPNLVMYMGANPDVLEGDFSNYKIPDNVTDMDSTFSSCSKIIAPPVIPESVKTMKWTFAFCYKLQKAPIIPSGVTNMESTFMCCKNLTGDVIINANPTTLVSCFKLDTQGKDIMLKGTSSMLQELANTSNSEYRTVYDSDGNILY